MLAYCSRVDAYNTCLPSRDQIGAFSGQVS
jgi:hypothetical protein